MPRINIEESWWTDERRFKLAELLPGGLYEADGLVIAAWRLSQQFWGSKRQKVPESAFSQIPKYQLLFDVDLAIKHGGKVYVRGTRQLHDWYASLKESASKGGKSKGKGVKQNASDAEAEAKSLTLTLPSSSFSDSFSNSSSFSNSKTKAQNKSFPEGSKAEPPGSEGPNLSRDVWGAYSDAYAKRYGISPIRNPKINSQIKAFLARVPAVEAANIARFYISHGDWYYVKNRHPVGFMLRDAEKLRTEWATGVKATQAEAKTSERMQSYQSQLERIEKGEL